MEKISTLAELSYSILLLEAKERDCRIEVISEFRNTVEKFSPANLIAKNIQSLAGKSDLKKTILSAVVTIGAGFLAKKFLAPTTPAPVKKLIGVFLQAGSTKVVIQKEVETDSEEIPFLERDPKVSSNKA